MATVNRYTRLSTSHFTPRNLQEIMGIPIAKQVQHDKQATSLGKLEDFDFNRVTGDNAQATSELADFRKKVDDSVNNLAQNGISSSSRASIRDLNRELKKNLSQTGKWGKKIAYYNAQQTWLKEMQKKENRGGWSPQAVNNFINTTSGGSSQDKNGNDTPFRGSYLPSYVNTVDWMRKAVGDIKESTLEELGIRHRGKLNFTDLYTDDTISGVDRQKIFDHIKGLAQTDKKLMSSLLMENKIGGLPPEKNPLAFGKMVTEKDPFSGKEVSYYKPASSLDAQAYSMATASEFKKLHKHNISVKDDYAVKKMQADFDAQIKFDKATGVVSVDGQAMDSMSYEGYSSLVNKSKNIDASLKNAKKDLAAVEEKYTKDSEEYTDMKNSIDILHDQLFNLDAQISFAKDKGIEGLSKSDRDFFDAGQRWEAFIKRNNMKNPTKEEKVQFFKQKGIDHDLKDVERSYYSHGRKVSIGIDTKMNAIIQQINRNSVDKLNEDKLNGVNSNKYSIFSSNDIKGFDQHVNSYEKSISGKNFDISKFSLNGAPLSEVLGEIGGSFSKTKLGENFIKTKDGTNYVKDKTKVSFTTNSTFEGNPEFIVTFEDANGLQSKGYKVTMGENGREMYRSIAKSLKSSPAYEMRELSDKLDYNTMHGLISASGMRTLATVKDGKFPGYLYNGRKATWNRYKNVLDTPRFTVNLNGETSKELKDTDDVERYLFMVDKMTNSSWGKADRTYWAEKFYNQYGENEYKKYLESDTKKSDKNTEEK